jgi:hypothetical protein
MFNTMFELVMKMLKKTFQILILKIMKPLYLSIKIDEIKDFNLVRHFKWLLLSINLDVLEYQILKTT